MKELTLDCRSCFTYFLCAELKIQLNTFHKIDAHFSIFSGKNRSTTKTSVVKLIPGIRYLRMSSMSQ